MAQTLIAICLPGLTQILSYWLFSPQAFISKIRNILSMSNNALKEMRESLLLSKAELSRLANVSPITITRIENGYACRLETKRKILLALGLNLSDKNKVFKD